METVNASPNVSRAFTMQQNAPDRPNTPLRRSSSAIDRPNFLREGTLLNRLSVSLRKYFSQPTANISSVPIGLELFSYGSTPIGKADLMLDGIKDDYVAAYVPTPLEAGQLRDVKANNITVGLWIEQIAQAVRRNGGLGNSEDGFLAWSKKGFIRLRNPRLSPEENRRLAAMSLQIGVAVERLPARSTKSASENPGIEHWIEKLLADYDKKLAQFLENPAEGISLQDGKRRFGLRFNEEIGVATSYYYKKRSGLKRFGRKTLELAGKAIQLTAPTGILPGSLGQRLIQKVVMNSVPGLREIGKKINDIFDSTRVKAILSLIDPARYAGELVEIYGKGQASLKQVVQAALARAQQGFDFLPAADPFTAVIKVVGMLTTRLLRGSKLSSSDFLSAGANFIPAVPGATGSQQVLQTGAKLGAASIDKSKKS